MKKVFLKTDGIYDVTRRDFIFGDTDKGNRMLDLILARYGKGGDL